MATFRQIAANQKNARKSTGLAGAGLLLPGDDQAAIETRKAEWRL